MLPPVGRKCLLIYLNCETKHFIHFKHSVYFYSYTECYSPKYCGANFVMTLSHRRNNILPNDNQPNDTQHTNTHLNGAQHYGTQHNDTQDNETELNDTQHNETELNDTQHNET